VTGAERERQKAFTPKVVIGVVAVAGVGCHPVVDVEKEIGRLLDKKRSSH
jgi:hypothetical protein